MKYLLLTALVAWLLMVAIGIIGCLLQNGAIIKQCGSGLWATPLITGLAVTVFGYVALAAYWLTYKFINLP